MSAYMLFCRDTCLAVAASFTTSREVGAELGRRWRELSAEGKAPFGGGISSICRY
jgi:hypothetical protein